MFDLHRRVDELKETELGKNAIATTRSGIGPAYGSKATRSGLRIHHLFEDRDDFEANFRRLVQNRQKRYGVFEYDIDTELNMFRKYAEKLKDMVVENVSFLRDQYLAKGKKVLVEGANAAMLDVDFGTYPYVTSSNCTIGGVFTGLGFSPRYMKEIMGVVKAYTTRVGNGPFPTELTNELGVQLQQVGHEFGTTTGRGRRCGWLDMVVLRYSHSINGYDYICLTKLDVLDDFDEIKIAVGYNGSADWILEAPGHTINVDYITLPGWKSKTVGVAKWEDLPEKARDYVLKIEELLQVPSKFLGRDWHYASHTTNHYIVLARQSSGSVQDLRGNRPYSDRLGPCPLLH